MEQSVVNVVLTGQNIVCVACGKQLCAGEAYSTQINDNPRLSSHYGGWLATWNRTHKFKLAGTPAAEGPKTFCNRPGCIRHMWKYSEIVAAKKRKAAASSKEQKKPPRPPPPPPPPFPPPPTEAETIVATSAPSSSSSVGAGGLSINSGGDSPSCLKEGLLYV